MPFNLADYEPVEERLARFWKDHPDGRISTRLLNESEGSSDGSVVMVAVIYKKSDDKWPTAIGHAQETKGEGMVNKTSWIENCETSAIGRALANMGYAPKGARPSREEMVKVAAPGQASPPRAAGRRSTSKKLRASQIRLLDTAKDADIDEDLRHRIVRRLTEGATQSIKDLDDDACDKITAQLKVFAAYRDAGMKNLEEWEAQQ